MVDKGEKCPDVQSASTLIKRRAYIKGKLTQLAKEDYSLLTVEGLVLKEERVRALFAEYERFTLEISETSQPDTETPGEADKNYFTALTAIKQRLTQLSNTDSKNTNSKPSFKVPELKINKFKGNYADYKSFIQLFNAAIDSNDKLQQIHKLCLLQGYLEGEPLDLIKNLPLISESYTEAKNILEQRYHNTYRIKNEHIGRILDITTVSKPTAANLREFVANTKQEKAALKNLGQGVESWDALLVCILTRKLDAYSVREFHLSRSSNEEPTLISLMHFLEKRATALEDSRLTASATIPGPAKATHAKKSCARSRAERTCP
ncbi:uncharacterized protein [Battus philenor]|uniref:uncharacterized protein n=1 Tax=Battus philenor TaxID=42288 RepID=UPI0035D04FBA